MLSALALLLMSQTISARTWYVNVNGTGDVPTIQAAVDSVASGDEIVVGPGRYTWANQGGGHANGLIYVPRGQDNFTLRSEAGPASTVLDAQGNNRIIFIQGYNGIVFDGFTLTGGVAPENGGFSGGGLVTHLGSDLIRNCIFEFNSATVGGALWCGGVSQITVESCTFRYNNASNGGAVVFINSSTASTLRDCVFYENHADLRGGAIYGLHNRLEIENCVFSKNRAFGTSGGALVLREMWPSSVTNCTIVQNESPSGAAIDVIESPAITVDRCIMAFQSGPAFVTSAGGVLTVSCNNVYANTDNSFPAGTVDLGGNFSAEPQFCDGLGSENFYLSGSSPCAPGNHPNGASCDLIGALGVACGQVTTETRTWGQLKALYR